MTSPSGAVQTLLAIKSWDYNWQEVYFLKTPMQVKAGMRLHVDAFFDNSEKNPRNPFAPPYARLRSASKPPMRCASFSWAAIRICRRRSPLSPLDPSAKAKEPKKDDTKKDDVKKPEAKISAKPGRVPYRLTDTNHTLVRVKINGKGPFNFIVDTGCPVLLIAEDVGKKIGLEKGFVTLDTLEMEGGLQLNGIKARVETPFQITGMNGLGLAGVELHGLMGFTVLAKYKIDYDYSKKQMAWTPLDFTPPPPQPLKGKVQTGGVDLMSTLVRC